MDALTGAAFSFSEKCSPVYCPLLNKLRNVFRKNGDLRVLNEAECFLFHFMNSLPTVTQQSGDECDDSLVIVAMNRYKCPSATLRQDGPRPVFMVFFFFFFLVGYQESQAEEAREMNY